VDQKREWAKLYDVSGTSLPSPLSPDSESDEHEDESWFLTDAIAVPEVEISATERRLSTTKKPGGKKLTRKKGKKKKKKRKKKKHRKKKSSNDGAVAGKGEGEDEEEDTARLSVPVDVPVDDPASSVYPDIELAVGEVTSSALILCLYMHSPARDTCVSPQVENQADIPTDHTEYKRLAVVNQDWRHVRAVDLLVLLQSFASAAGGMVESVAIYPSKFGMEAMKQVGNILSPPSHTHTRTHTRILVLTCYSHHTGRLVGPRRLLRNRRTERGQSSKVRTEIFAVLLCCGDV